MALPQRCFYSLVEASMRWGCLPSDVAGWAASGLLELVASITPVRANEARFVGLVAIPATDLLPMFRRCGTGPGHVTILRVREPGTTDWQFITEPAEGVPVAAADIVITRRELERFEDEHAIMGARRAGGPGANPKWDWDGFYTALIRRIHEGGLPETQAELIGEMQAWFEQHSEIGAAPDESTIRKRIRSIWHALRG